MRPSARLSSGGAVSGVAKPSQPACISIIFSSGKSFSFSRMGAPVSRLSRSAPPTWSMWAWVTRICLSLRPSSVSRRWMRPTSSPGSMTMASPVLVAEDGAVACERADGKGLQNHGFIVERSDRRLMVRVGCGWGPRQVEKRAGQRRDDVQRTKRQTLWGLPMECIGRWDFADA